MKKVTINDIARAANVAKSTVSKVMNDAPTVSEDTKRRIRAIMREMKYTPSSIATQLARRSSFNIGLLVDISRKEDFLNHFFYTIIGGIESVIGPLNYELTISNVASMGEHHFMSRLVHNRRVDGLIMDNSILARELAEELHSLDFPFISIGSIAGTKVASWVDIDNAAGGAMLTQHLLDLGCRRPAFIGGSAGDPIFLNRSGGFTRTLQASGFTVEQDWIRTGQASEETGRLLTRELLTGSRAPDAMVCINNHTAYGALQAVRELGLRIPEDIRIVAFDNAPLAPYTSPPLTCLHLDTFELGVQAGTMLMERIEQPELPVKSHMLLPKLILRESTMGPLAPGTPGENDF